jgi:UDP-3-O-acyl N-acetylglucosamine deacetylase
MVEHVLAALAGLKIDNCEIWVNQPEMPGMDGSSLAFVGALDSAGVVDQNALRAQIVVREITRLGDEEVWIEARPVNGPVATLKFRLEFAGCPAIGRQTVQFPHSSDAFRRELAPARTFLRQEEAEWLQARGIATRATYDNVLVFDADGPIQNKLRFRDECARHKTLDLIGDLSLSGCDLVGHFIAHRSGHRLNADLVRALLHEEQIEYSDDVRRSA